jgi:protein-L-isoaspartate(D-aspartate) O-methyltransferase
MVRRQLAARDITDRRVLSVMASVPREQFVPPHLVEQAYEDGPLPIGCHQTISQPYIVALMVQGARVGRHSRVLDVGTGSGYQTAILARLAHHVWSVERIETLSRDAGERLEMLDLHNVTLVVGDGARGYPLAAPFDAILVAAAAPRPPAPLLEQLAPGGSLVIPIGDRSLQELFIVRREGTDYVTETAGPCRFVPLVSSEAFAELG